MSNPIIWHFGQSAAEEHGPKDSITTTFKGDKYYSLAREVNQNSLDAINDKSAPVLVKFSLFELYKNEIEPFFVLRDVFKSCSEYFPSDKKFNDFCDEANNILSQDSLKCLRISDFNTTGLIYSDGKCPFYAFMKAVGYNHKPTTGAGGSFGFGKGAYYAASSIRTIIVSSIYDDNKFIFQGKARLTTHKDANGTLRDYTGLFGLNNGIPVTSLENIPASLQRKEKGTDIIIMGFKETATWKDSLIKSVLNNFWYAIYDQKLVVEVDDILINKETLENIILSYYTDLTFDGSVNEAETWNPYPYFKAVKFKDDVNTKYFQKELETLGEVKLYLYLKDQLPNRTVYMRAPKMTVFKKTDNRGFNYSAVFICENEKGNEILRQMENPQHNEWKKNNYLDDDTPHIDAKKAEDEIRQFMKECLESLMISEGDKKQKIFGLDKFLNIPEDLIADNNGDGEASGAGDSSGSISSKESSVETTYREDETPINLQVTRKSEVLTTDKGLQSEEGVLSILSGTEGSNTLNTSTSSNSGADKGDSEVRGSEQGDSQIRKPLNLKCRVIAQRAQDGVIEHIVKINSHKEVLADIELIAGVDNDSEDDNMLNIIEAKVNNISINYGNNKIHQLPLSIGWNIVKIRFDSNQKHSLKFRSYEF